MVQEMCLAFQNGQVSSRKKDRLLNALAKHGMMYTCVLNLTEKFWSCASGLECLSWYQDCKVREGKEDCQLNNFPESNLLINASHDSKVCVLGDISLYVVLKYVGNHIKCNVRVSVGKCCKALPWLLFCFQLCAVKLHQWWLLRSKRCVFRQGCQTWIHSATHFSLWGSFQRERTSTNSCMFMWLKSVY